MLFLGKKNLMSNLARVYGKLIQSMFFIGSIITLSACGGGGGENEPTLSTQTNLSISVTGAGSVSGNAGAIDCSTSCNYKSDVNSQIILSASAQTGYSFQQWSGACSGSGSCSINMNLDRAVAAVFVIDNVEPTEYLLNVSIVGNGVVNLTPSGISCAADCSQSFSVDTVVTVTPQATEGYLFDHWSGACSGNVACNISLTSNKDLTATFVEDSGQQSGIKIEEYSAPNDAFQLGEIPNNASGITWHEGLQQYLVVRNNAGMIYRYDVNFAYLGELHVSGINQDTEGLAFVGGNEVMVATEGNFLHKLVIEEFTNEVDGSLEITQAYRLLPPPPSSNSGLEGVAIRRASNGALARAYACQEGGSGNDMRLVYFDVPAIDPLVLLSYDSNLTVVEPFNADQAFAGAVTDLAGMAYDERTGHLIIVSQESRKAIQVNPQTGAIISSLNLLGAPQFEGVTIGPNGELVFVSEGNWIRIYTRS